MPINELEQHPYLKYYTDLDKPKDWFEGLIIGSFPIYHITDTVDENHNVTEQRFNEKKAGMRFFYGSLENSLWGTLAKIFKQPEPFSFPIEQRVTEATRLLTDHRLLISDVVCRTNREKESSEDSALMNRKATTVSYVAQGLSLNYSLIEMLVDHPGIKNLYFTASSTQGNSPYSWFKQIASSRSAYEFKELATFPVGLEKKFSIEISLLNRKFTVYLLPTPAGKFGRGIHFTDSRKHEVFCNYMNSVDPVFYSSIKNTLKVERSEETIKKLSQHRQSLFLEIYRQAIVLNNNTYSGKSKESD